MQHHARASPRPERGRSLVVDSEKAGREQCIVELRRMLHSLLWVEQERSILKDGDGSQEAGTPVNTYATGSLPSTDSLEEAAEEG